MAPHLVPPTVAATVPRSGSKNGHETGPIGSDSAQNPAPGLIFHEDSESGLRMGGSRGKDHDFGEKLAIELAIDMAMVGSKSPLFFKSIRWGDGLTLPHSPSLPG